MKTTSTKNRLTPVLTFVLALSFTACDSNPLDPIEDQSASNQSIHSDKLPTVRVSYRISSEKGIPSDIDMLMWVPEQGRMMFEKGHVSDTDYEYTFEAMVHELDNLRFTLNSANDHALLRAFIYVNEEIEAFGTADASAPMVALEMPADKANKSCELN